MYKGWGGGGGAVHYNEIVALLSRWRNSDKKSTHIGCATHKLRTLTTLTCTRWALENTLEIFTTNFASTG